MIKLGLIGYPLGHSFSKNYYLTKFEKENIDSVHYDTYSIEHIDQFPKIFDQDQTFRGFNVTLPHKQAVIPYVDELSEEASVMKAVNCITISYKDEKAILKGYNTDSYGSQKSLEPLLLPYLQQSFVLRNVVATITIFLYLD